MKIRNFAMGMPFGLIRALGLFAFAAVMATLQMAAAVTQAAAAADSGYIDTHNHAPTNPTCDYDAMVDVNGDGVVDETYGSEVQDVVVANMDTYGIEVTLFMPPPHGVDNSPLCNYDHLTEMATRNPDNFAILLGGETLNLMIQQVVKGEATYEEKKDEFANRALEILATGAVGFGEMAAEHFSLHDGHPYISAPPDHQLFLDLADIAAEHDVPIDLHMEAIPSDIAFADLPACSALYGQSQHVNPDVFSANIPNFEGLLDHNPNTRIVWVHAGWDNTGERTASLTRQLLNAHANLYIQLRPLPSKSQVCNPITTTDNTGNVSIDSDWLALIEDFPDRFVVGLDSFYSPFRSDQTFEDFLLMLEGDLKAGQGFMRKLRDYSADLARKVGRDNAVRIYKLGGQIQFSSPSYGVDEGIGTATITVQRTGFTIGSVTVDYATSDGTAIGGFQRDYEPTSGTLTFAAGETTKTFTVPIVDDDIVENNETVNLTLSNPTGGATLGSVSTAVLTIANNDVEFHFKDASYAVNEAGGTATITVERLGGIPGTVTVDYATSDSTAKAGTDYTATSGTLSFSPGDSGVKAFMVPIVNNTLPDAHRTVNLALCNPTNSNGSAAVAAPSTAVLTILNDDVVFRFSRGAFVALESEPSVTITVRRIGATPNDVSVDYATGGGAATAGSDYIPASGTLTFSPGDATKSFTVKLLDDPRKEGNEDVILRLSNATNTAGTARLGEPDMARIAIVDDDHPAPGL